MAGRAGVHPSERKRATGAQVTAPALDQNEPAHRQNGMLFMSSPKATRDCNGRMEENRERDFFAVILEPGPPWRKKTRKKTTEKSVRFFRRAPMAMARSASYVVSG